MMTETAAHLSITKHMLKIRENHARLQKKDFSHVFRKKSNLDILRLSAIALGIGIVYAAETAFVSPTLLQIGVDHITMTMVWALSPTLGFFFSPLVGSLSDQCKLQMGRRRPIMLILSLGILFGFIFLPFGRNFGQLFGDDISLKIESMNITTDGLEGIEMPGSRGSLKFAIIFTVLGTLLLDFDAETCQTPARAYMLDVCIPQDHGKALSSFSMMAGVGSTIGYAIGGIDWETTTLGKLMGGNIQTVFMIDTLIFVVCFFVTFLSFREIPLSLIEKDELLRPLSADVMTHEVSKDNNNHNNFCIETNILSKTLSDQESLNPRSPSNTSDNENFEHVSFSVYLKSIFIMPSSLRILSLTNLLCWMGHICYCLYFTDFVGQAVFHGDPTAPPDSEEYRLYEAGVRFGGWGMAIYAFTQSVYSFYVDDLMDRFRPKYVYVAGIMVFAIGIYILAAWPTKIGVLTISVTAGIIYATIYTVPYILIAEYHTKSCFEVRDGKAIPLKQPRGLGTDMAIINSMMFIAQIVMSLCAGYLVVYTETTASTLYASSVLSVLAAVSATFVLYI